MNLKDLYQHFKDRGYEPELTGGEFYISDYLGTEATVTKEHDEWCIDIQWDQSADYVYKKSLEDVQSYLDGEFYNRSGEN